MESADISTMDLEKVTECTLEIKEDPDDDFGAGVKELHSFYEGHVEIPSEVPQRTVLYAQRVHKGGPESLGKRIIWTAHPSNVHSDAEPGGPPARKLARIAPARPIAPPLRTTLPPRIAPARPIAPQLLIKLAPRIAPDTRITPDPDSHTALVSCTTIGSHKALSSRTTLGSHVGPGPHMKPGPPLTPGRLNAPPVPITLAPRTAPGTRTAPGLSIAPPLLINLVPQIAPVTRVSPDPDSHTPLVSCTVVGSHKALGSRTTLDSHVSITRIAPGTHMKPGPPLKPGPPVTPGRLNAPPLPTALVPRVAPGPRTPLVPRVGPVTLIPPRRPGRPRRARSPQPASAATQQNDPAAPTPVKLARIAPRLPPQIAPLYFVVKKADEVSHTLPNNKPKSKPRPRLRSSDPGSSGSSKRYQRTRTRSKKTDHVITKNYGSDDSDDDDWTRFATRIARVDRVYLRSSEYEDQPPGDQLSPAPPTPDADFKWTCLPHPPIPAEQRREVFAATNCGPTAATPTPYDTFAAIWDQRIMEHIAQETNRYARRELDTLARTQGSKKNCHYFTNTKADEIYIFFALLLATGVCAKSDIAEYWAKDCSATSTPNVSFYMSHGRFQLLTKYLHFTDNDVDVSRLSRADARLRKVAPVVEHLNERFQALYAPGRDVVVDAALAQWKGWSDIGRREGIKVYELYEAKTGYLWRFHLHSGETPVAESSLVSRVSVSGVVPRRVLSLLEGLQYKGHTVWMDRSFSSPALARALRTLGFNCVGTLQTMPPELAASKPETVAGQIHGATSGDVDVLMWSGHRRVGMVSTYHGGAVRTEHGRSTPSVLHDYNACMEGLDKKDDMLASYSIFDKKRAKVWYKTFFKRLLNASVFNAFVLHRRCALSEETTRLEHREFRKCLINELLARHAPRRAAPTGRLIFSKEVREHFPATYGYIEGTKIRPRGRCAQCEEFTVAYCPRCQVSLCPFTCHVAYHMP